MRAAPTPNAPSVVPRQAAAAIQLPKFVSPIAVVGVNGRVQKRVEQLSGARIRYVPDDHKVDILGVGPAVKDAAQLIDRNIRQFLLTRPKGYPQRHRAHVNILSAWCGPGDEYVLQNHGRPLMHGVRMGTTFSRQADSDAGPTTSDWQEERRVVTDELALAGLELACQSPVDYDDLSIKFILGKSVAGNCPLPPAKEMLNRTQLMATLLRRTEEQKLLFDANMTQEAVKDLDRYLLGHGATTGQLERTISVQLATSIQWVQYHVTFVLGADKQPVLQSICSESFKAGTATVMAPMDMVDYRARVLGKAAHLEDDPIVQAIRDAAAAGQFRMIDDTQISVPASLQQVDLSLMSARVMVRRSYSCLLPADCQPSALVQAGVLQEQPPVPEPLSVVSTVTAVVDNTGRRGLEVTMTCAELNALLMSLHQGTLPGGNKEQYLLLRKYIASMQAYAMQIQTNVPSYLSNSQAAGR